MDELFSKKIIQLFNNLTKDFDKHHLLLAKTDDKKNHKWQVGQYLYYHYMWTIKTAHQTEQAHDTAVKYKFYMLTPHLHAKKADTQKVEKDILKDLESLKLTDRQINNLKTKRSFKTLIDYIDKVSAYDPESFIIFQLYAEHLSLKIQNNWNKYLNLALKDRKSSFSLTDNYTNIRNDKLKDNTLSFLNKRSQDFQH
jgi:hypothetical protein